jgi:SulP family sulfate permease
MTTLLQNARPDRATFKDDASAGFTFAVVNIPQAMANALLATVNPVLGLYTLMIATPIGAIFTSSIYMNVSTTSALSVATGDALVGVPDAEKAASVAVLVLLVGILQLLAGLFRLGSFIRFVSKSVMVGFTTGVALLIILGQVDELTGYSSRFSGKILQLADTILNLGQLDNPTLAIGLLTIGLIFGIGRTRFNKAAFIIALLVATLVTYLFNLETVATVGQIATIPDSLRNFNLPNLVLIPDLLASAAAIAIIGLVQGAGVSQSYPNPNGKFPDLSGDFRGQGLANIATGFFQGIPGGGSLSGTSLVVNTGMQSRWANILAGLFIVPLVLLFKGVISLIPMPALAGLLIVVGYQSLKPHDIEMVWQTGQVSRVAMGLTLAATLTLPLQFAVFVGVAVSILMHVFQSSNQVRLVQFTIPPHGFPIETPVPPRLHDREVVVLHAYGSLFFAAASTIETQLPEVNNAREAAVIFILRGRDDVGSTLITVLDRYARALQAGNGRLLLAEVDEKVHDQLQRTGLLRLLGEENVYLAQPQLGVALNLALESVSAWLDGLVDKERSA